MQIIQIFLETKWNSLQWYILGLLNKRKTCTILEYDIYLTFPLGILFDTAKQTVKLPQKFPTATAKPER